MQRGSFIVGSASAVAAVPVVTAAAPPGGTHLVERFSDFNEAAFDRAVGKPADIRQMWEAVSFHPEMLNNVKNALNGLQFGFRVKPPRIAMVICPHGPSASFTYDDSVWSKYRIGEAFHLRDAAKTVVTSNVFLKSSARLDHPADPDDPNGAYQDTSISALQRRGVVFLTCHTAVEEQARKLVSGGYAPHGAKAKDVASDILTHLIPGTIVVPSMVAAIAVLQNKYKYSYVTLAF